MLACLRRQHWGSVGHRRRVNFNAGRYYHRACTACGVLQPLKDRRTRRLQTLFGTVEVEATRFKVCGCRRATPLAEVTVSPVCALLTARCTPELERVQAELGARTSFRDAARILECVSVRA